MRNDGAIRARNRAAAERENPPAHEPGFGAGLAADLATAPTMSAVPAVTLTATPPDPGPASSQPAKREVSALGRGLLGIALAVPLSALPKRWRTRVRLGLPWTTGTILSGMVQASLAVFLGVEAYLHYWNGMANEIAALAAASEYSDLVAMSNGAATWLYFLLTPAGLAMLFNLGEGMLRAGGAASTGRPHGIAVLWIAAELEKPLRLFAARWLSPAIPDEITRDSTGQLVRVASCRERGWDRTTTISFEGTLYVLRGHRREARLHRPFVYDLAPAPASHTVRRIESYDPGVLPRLFDSR
jgi:hypothetical protein